MIKALLWIAEWLRGYSSKDGKHGDDSEHGENREHGNSTSFGAGLFFI